jgi:hypothetical protein
MLLLFADDPDNYTMHDKLRVGAGALAGQHTPDAPRGTAVIPGQSASTE